MSDIAILVQRNYAKPAYANENFNVRAWPGLMMIQDALQRAGYDVERCVPETAHRYKVVLVSIQAACDWYPYVRDYRERFKETCVIVGGPGVLNVRPLLRFASVFVFGRGEDLIVPLVKAALAGERYKHPSVCYADEFSPDREYVINQAEGCYPHEVKLANGKVWREEAIGCQRKCFFCAYTWHRKHVGSLQTDAGAGNAIWNGPSREYTIWEVLERKEIGPQLIAGLDGISARLRKMVNKPITQEMFREFLRILASAPKANRIRLYCVVGYPSETEDDWQEFFEDLHSTDDMPPVETKWGIGLQCQHFVPMPATPAATWETQQRNYRNYKVLSFPISSTSGVRTIFDNNVLWVSQSWGSTSLSNAILDILIYRGLEEDADVILSLARNKRFWRAYEVQRERYLEKICDIPRLFGRYTWDTLPTKYLGTYCCIPEVWPDRVAGFASDAGKEQAKLNMGQECEHDR